VKSRAVEVTVMLPSRTERGYWIEKNFPTFGRSGRVIQTASLAVEVTAQRKLKESFRKFAGELLQRNEEYHRLAQELHESINGYPAALGVTLDRLSRYITDPESIPELLTQSMEFLDVPIRKLASAVARCFPIDHQH
jgi:signal transduction histidine kinase